MANSISLNCESNVVTFCQKRLNPPAVSAIIKQFPAGVQTSNLEQNLQDSDYIPILSAVWGERSKERRVEWLRSHADLHAPLMFELAIAEFVLEPTVDTVSRISLPLIRAAAVRVHQDACCSIDSSVCRGDAEFVMKSAYENALMRAAQKYAPSLDLSAALNEKSDETRRCIQERLLAISTRTLEAPQTLPNPIWIGYHGMAMFIKGHPDMAPSEQFAELRQKVARERILPQVDIQVLS